MRREKNDEDRWVDIPEWYMNLIRSFYNGWLMQRECAGDEWRGKDIPYTFHTGYELPIYFPHPTAL